jgi:stearoyl-CoA desaturase (delta-9 desaturase)
VDVTTNTIAAGSIGASMTRRQRIGNLVGLTIPFAAFVAAIVLTWRELVGPTDLAILVVMYTLSALGATVGFHRLLTHRSFQTHKPVEYLFAVLGTLSVQGSVIDWVADHRRHHAHADAEGDPHSPYGHGPGLRGALLGLWHAHAGWLLTDGHQADASRYAKDLVEDRGMILIDRAFLPIVAAGLAIPFGLGYLITGELGGALTAMLWGGLARVFLFHHATFSVNSICHFFGRRRFDTEDRSTNVFWLALPSMGEAWHNNHHAFPRSAYHGLRWWELDVSALVIRSMHRAGLAWNVVEVPSERQRERERSRHPAPPVNAPAR